MSDIRPWMRRVAEQYEKEAEHCPNEAECRTCMVEAIAAHAPPVEEMQKALQELSEYYVLGKVPPAVGMWQRAGESLTAYDDWLKREEATDGTR